MTVPMTTSARFWMPVLHLVSAVDLVPASALPLQELALVMHGVLLHLPVLRPVCSGVVPTWTVLLLATTLT